VTVLIQRERYAGMPQEPGYSFGMLTLHKPYCSARMPELVKDYIRQPRTFEDRFEGAVVKVIRVRRCALDGWEDEPALAYEIPL
jgi:hypothetical protein